MTRRFYIILILVLFTMHCYSQRTKSKYDFEVFPVLAANVGKFTFATIGVCLGASTGHTDFPTAYNYYLGNEIKIDNKLLIGPKVGGWVTFNFVTMEMNFIYYSNFHTDAFVYRPEVGIEFRRLKLSYGYNVSLNNKSFTNINSHLGEFTYSFRRKLISRKRII